MLKCLLIVSFISTKKLKIHYFLHIALAFFNQVDLLYGSVSERCTVASCPTMSAPGSA